MSRGPQPRVSGRVDPHPRPDTVKDLICLYTVVAAVMTVLLFVPAWIASLI